MHSLRTLRIFVWRILKKFWNVMAPIRSVVTDIFVLISDLAGKWANSVLGSGVFESWFGTVEEGLDSFGEKVSAFAGGIGLY